MKLLVETEDGDQYYFDIEDGTKRLEVAVDKTDVEVVADGKRIECEAMKV